MGASMTNGKREAEDQRTTAGTKRAAGGARKAVLGKSTASKSGSGESRKTQNSETGNDKASMGGEAHSVMGSRTSLIVENLLGRTMRGDGKSARMLQGLANKESEAKEVLKHGPLRSQALAWAAEPPWQDELDAETAETGSGSREAE
jgi:hypothetical protein